MATHVHGDPAAGTIHVPEMRSVGSIMFLGLLQQGWLAQRAAVEELFETDVFGSEAEFLGVHELHLGLAASLDHLVRFSEVEAKWFFHHHMFACRCRIESDCAMPFIGHSYHHHIQLRHRQQLLVIGEMVWNPMFRCKPLRIACGGGSDRKYLGFRASFQTYRVDVSDELRTDRA